MPETENLLNAPDPQDDPQVGEERTLYEARPALVPSVGALIICIVTLGLALIGYWLKQRSRHYRFTTERVVVERGIFSKRMDQIDIYRINDYVVERPFGQRIMGTGNLILETMDRSSPQMRINHLATDVTALYEQLRHATEEQKRQRGVRVIDYE